MRTLLASILFLAAVSAVAQTPFDFSKVPLTQPALIIPERAIESEPREEPEMAAYKPAGAGPFPAVVVFHTCGGVQDHVGDWSKLLLKAGYVAFVVDSFTQRDVPRGANCRPPTRVTTLQSALDAHHALEFLASQPYVDKERIGLVGMSWGAMVGLLSARKDIAGHLPRKMPELRFRAIAALYPHCFLPSVPTAQGRVSVEWLGQDSDRPLLVLMGERDEETPAKYCLPRLESLKAKGANVDWHVYPGATHAWDARRLSGYRAPTQFGGSHTYEYSAATTKAAQERVLQFFAKEMPAK